MDLKNSIFVIAAVTCFFCEAKETNSALAKIEKMIDHQPNKIIVKSRKNNAQNWKTDREFTLMFDNNRKAKKGK